ncbi:MAG: hypothetical protein Q9160_003876 [Pyrenula sp. 1 TL-2023]
MQLGYYYFSYNNRIDSTTDMFIRSLLHQFSFTTSHCSSDLDIMYEASKKSKSYPTSEDLLSILQKILSSIEDAYIILDALDEAVDQNTLWQTLNAIKNDKDSRTHILLMSRNSIEIGYEMTEAGLTQLQIDEQKVDRDIRLVVGNRLKTDHKLHRITSGSEGYVEASLMQKAGGMWVNMFLLFRVLLWYLKVLAFPFVTPIIAENASKFQMVDKQLKRLRSCLNKRKLDEALRSLPNDLNETWQKCYDTLNHKGFASEGIRMLTWLCFSQRPMRDDECINALALPYEWSEQFNLDRFPDANALFEIGSGLVESDQRSKGDDSERSRSIFRLAHASVKDWLMSERMIDQTIPDGSPFIESTAHGSLARDCMMYLMHLRASSDSAGVNDLPLARHAANYWRYHLSNSVYDVEMVQCACKILQNDGIRETWAAMLDNDTMSWYFPQWPFSKRVDPSETETSERKVVPLMYAIEAGLYPVVECLLQATTIDLNQGSWQATPLQAAVRNDHLRVLKLLIKAGAKVNAAGSFREPCLNLACMYGSVETIRTLLTEGATIGNSKSGLGPLHHAARREDNAILRVLLEYGASINIQSSDDMRRTALHEAATSLRLSKVRLLLEFGADKRILDDSARLPLHCAVRDKRCTRELASLLYCEGAESSRAKMERPAMEIAISEGSEDVCKFLLEKSKDLEFLKNDAIKLLKDAAGNGFLPAVKFFLRKGDLLAKEDGTGALFSAIQGAKLDVVKFLVQQGTPLETKDSTGTSPFLSAIKQGREDIWRYLADAGANIHATDAQGDNACSIATFHNDLTCLQWTIDQKASVNQKSTIGMSPLLIGAEAGNVEALQILIGQGAEKDVTDDDGKNACHIAAANGRSEALQWLIDHKVDANLSNKYGFTPFHVAVVCGHLKCVQLLAKLFPDWTTRTASDGWSAAAMVAESDNIDVASWMIQNGVDFDQAYDSENPPMKRFRPLIQSVLRGEFAMVEFLLENGADPNVRMNHGSTPLLVVSEWQSLKFIEILVKHGAEKEGVIDNDGDDCLMCFVINSDAQVLRWTLESPPDTSYRNKRRFTPMHRGAWADNAENFRLLHQAGFEYPVLSFLDDATPYPNDFRETSIYRAPDALKNPHKPIYTVPDVYSPLMIAVFLRNNKVSKYLLEQYPQIQTCLDMDGNDILTYACCAGNIEFTKYVLNGKSYSKGVNKARRTSKQETELFLKCLIEDNEEMGQTLNKEGDEERDEETRENRQEIKPRNETWRHQISETLTILQSLEDSAREEDNEGDGHLNVSEELLVRKGSSTASRDLERNKIEAPIHKRGKLLTENDDDKDADRQVSK